MSEALDSRLLRALAEPARIEVLKALVELGPCDIETLAERCPQDRSVVSRHLQQLEDAGVLTSSKEGRRRLYSLDGAALVQSFSRILETFQRVVAICCPPAKE